MKTMLLFTIVIGSLLMACKHARRDPQTMEWKCGEGALTVTKPLEKDHSGDLTLTMDRKSLCQSSGIKVRIMAADKAIYEETIAKFPFSQTWKIDREAAIAVTTEVVGVDSDVRCIRLGLVNCTLKY